MVLKKVRFGRGWGELLKASLRGGTTWQSPICRAALYSQGLLRTSQ